MTEKEASISKELLNKRLAAKDKKWFDTIVMIVDAFNRITGKDSQYHTDGNLSLILHQLRRGHGLAQFEGVFDYKYRMFKDDPVMKKHISISTFCRQGRFEINLEGARQEYIDRRAEEAKIRAANTQRNPSMNSFANLLKKV